MLEVQAKKKRAMGLLMQAGKRFCNIQRTFMFLSLSAVVVSAQPVTQIKTKLTITNQFVLEAKSLIGSARLNLKQLEQLNREKLSESMIRTQIKIDVRGEPTLAMQLFEQLKKHNPSCGLQSVKIERENASQVLFEISTIWFCYEV
jgi:hypothetical protein